MRTSWIKTLVVLFLIVGLPIFVWAVATQRIELRKKAATSEPTQICWNRVIVFNDAYHWPNGCKGSPRTDLACTLVLVPLTADEITGYQRWVSEGRPYIHGCGMPVSKECRPCGPTNACTQDLICQQTVVIQGRCEANGLCNEPERKLLCVKPDGSSNCIITPTPVQRCTSNADCPAGYICSAVPPGGCPTVTTTSGIGVTVPCATVPRCWPVNPTPTPVQRCTSNADCPAGYICSAVPPGGCPTVTTTSGIGVTVPCATVPRCWPVNPTPTPTPPPNCYYKLVQCIQAPCPPILVCPTPTWYTTPTPTPTPSCTPYPPCYYPISPDQPRCTLLSNINYCPPVPMFTLSVNGAVPELLPNQVMPLTIKVSEYDGSAGTPEEGFNVQVNVDAWPLSVNTPSVFSQNTVFNPITGLWELTVPPQNAGRYRIQVNAYCAVGDSLCSIRYGAFRQLEWTYYFSAVIPQPQNLTFKVKLAGVNGPEAQGATITVKLKLKDGTVLPFDKPLVLNSVGNGVYEATAALSNPLAAGTAMRVLVKGEKHSQIVFCRQSGQTEPCNDTDYITPSSYSFDFTGRPLPPGDLNQDGKVNTTDLKLITDLFNKPSSQLTAADLKTADVDYSGTIDTFDLNLVLQTLETRYDEQ